MVTKSLTVVGSGTATLVQMQGAPVAFPDEAVVEIRGASSVTISNMSITGPQDGILVFNSS